MKLATFALLAVGLSECPPSPTTTDAGPPRALDAAMSICGQACSRLADLGCAEGKAPNCEATCNKSALLTTVHPYCLADAGSKAEARAGGSVACP